jgi:UDP-N-acetylglucosamine 2-epimerase (non-hydrolysing)
MSIMLVMGTRPEIVKMAPVVWAMDEIGLGYTTVYTNQHYDFNLSSVFLKEFNLPKPDHFLVTRDASHARQTASTMTGIEEVIVEEKPSLVVVQGDTNTVLASAIAAVKCHVPVAHVESGIRSFDFRMAEEHNRRLTDHVSSLLFAPTEWARRNLESESVRGKVFVTGNTVVDSVHYCFSMLHRRNRMLESIRCDLAKEFALATVHRAENVDDEGRLKSIVEILTNSPIPVVFPIHPRTVKMLKTFDLYESLSGSENVQLLEPLGYFDFLSLMREARLILTDSGGVQEEATASHIRRFVLVLRDATDRPEAIEAGFGKLVGVDPENVLKEIDHHIDGFVPPTPSPYGDGFSGKRTVNIIRDMMEQGFVIDMQKVGSKEVKQPHIIELEG